MLCESTPSDRRLFAYSEAAVWPLVAHGVSAADVGCACLSTVVLGPAACHRAMPDAYAH